MFLQSQMKFSPSSSYFDENIQKQFKSVSMYIKAIKVLKNDFWSEKDIYIINSLGIEYLYSVYNDPYKQIEDEVLRAMRRTVTAHEDSHADASNPDTQDQEPVVDEPSVLYQRLQANLRVV